MTGQLAEVARATAAGSTNGRTARSSDPSPALTGFWLTVAGLSAVGAAFIGILGFVVSYSAVRTAVEPSFGHLAWAVPVGIDVGIFVFTAIDLLYSRMGMRMRGLRLVPWGLVAASVYLNVAASAANGDAIGGVAHGVLPGLWVVVVEVGAHAMRSWGLVEEPAGDELGRMDRVRFSRWLLAPLSTLRIRRWMILWEERSYDAALERWRARRRARSVMAKKHGGPIRWRWRAPIDQRLDYRDGALATMAQLLDDPAGSQPPPAGSAPAGSPTRRAGGSPRTATPKAPRSGDGKRRLSDDELLEVVRDIDRRYTADGSELTTRALRTELEALGIGFSNERAGKALAAVRADGNGQAEQP